MSLIVLSKNSVLCILLVGLVPCSKKHELVGTWKVKNYNLCELGVGFMHGARGYLLGTTIRLNSDSTYEEKNCGGSCIGKWLQQGDSLILIANRTWYNKPFLHIKHVNPTYDSVVGEPVHWRIAYLINGSKLIKYSKSGEDLNETDSNLAERKKARTFIEILKAVELDKK